MIHLPHLIKPSLDEILAINGGRLPRLAGGATGTEVLVPYEFTEPKEWSAHTGTALEAITAAWNAATEAERAKFAKGEGSPSTTNFVSLSAKTGLAQGFKFGLRGEAKAWENPEGHTVIKITTYAYAVCNKAKAFAAGSLISPESAASNSGTGTEWSSDVLTEGGGINQLVTKLKKSEGIVFDNVEKSTTKCYLFIFVVEYEEEVTKPDKQALII